MFGMISTLIILYIHPSYGQSNYCEFSSREIISSQQIIPESNLSSYFYFDTQNYLPVQFSNTSKNSSSQFTLKGNFGQLSKILNGSRYSYNAYAISLTTPSFHTLNGYRSEIEVLVHHSSSNSNFTNELILSFLFNSSQSSSNSSRVFFNSLNNSISGQGQITPQDLPSGLYFIKSFYYSNSLNNQTSSCQNIEWVVYQELDTIDKYTLSYIKSSLLNNGTYLYFTPEFTNSYTLYTGDQVSFSPLLLLSLSYLII